MPPAAGHNSLRTRRHIKPRQAQNFVITFLSVLILYTVLATYFHHSNQDRTRSINTQGYDLGPEHDGGYQGREGYSDSNAQALILDEGLEQILLSQEGILQMESQQHLGSEADQPARYPARPPRTDDNDEEREDDKGAAADIGRLDVVFPPLTRTNKKKTRVLLSKPLPPTIPTRKAKAAFVMLVRERDLHGARSAVRQVEDRFNRGFQYPYVFLNDGPFSKQFQDTMRAMSKAEMTFGQIPKEHWSYPEWISTEKAAQTRKEMRNVIYGWSESYRHMCRYQSGFFFQHELVLPYDYYWRIEPDVKYSCDLDFDPFLYMQDNKKKYAFTITLFEYEQTIPGLWNATKDFMKKYPHLLAKDNALDLISDDGGETYNRCHFWSNFEIADARWMRSEGYQTFFNHLDHAGGFFYERWGDAPVHSIAAALLLPIKELHFFKEVGYFHKPFYNCPAEPELQAKCHCDPERNMNREYWACTTRFLQMTNQTRMVYPEEVDD